MTLQDLIIEYRESIRKETCVVASIVGARTNDFEPHEHGVQSFQDTSSSLFLVKRSYFCSFEELKGQKRYLQRIRDSIGQHSPAG